jgi:RimJ/RimL family protein N-acetyltransferase
MAQEILNNIGYTQGKKEKKKVEYWHIKVGSLRVGHISIEFNSYVSLLDIYINQKYRNMGIGTMALKHCVEASKHNEIIAIISKKNKASHRVFEKNGFKIEMNNGPQLRMVYRKV